MMLNHVQKTILVVLLLLSGISMRAQMCELGFTVGVSTYQGDISPLGWRVSFEGAHIARGAFLSYSITDFVSLKARYNSAFISATDENALSADRRRRNLHFKSDLKEISLVAEVKLLSVVRSLRKFKLQPYINFGIGIFKFNPQAKYQGYWHDLQPLGTEGQGLPGSDTEKYSLTQFSIPFGFGLKYQINEEFVISAEISPRWTFTDHLDDVSGTYPNLELLAQTNGELAANLSYRGDKIAIDDANLENVGRGNSGENDWYLISSIGVAYRFDPGVYFDRRKGYHGYWKCPYN